jgi:uncharacterized protein (UPF0332 family)
VSITPIDQLIQIRLEQARESLKEAQTLFQAQLFRGTINRAYYAMFYAILALTVLRQETISKHSGIIAFFDRDFVKTGIFSKELSKSLHLAFQRRQENDYGDVFMASDEDARQALIDANIFVESVEKYFTSLNSN